MDPEAVTDAPAPEVTAVPEAQPELTPAADAAAEATPEPKPKQTPWFQSRINELTREKHEHARETDAAKAENAVLRATLEAMKRGAPAEGAEPPKSDGSPPTSPAEIEALVERRAAEKAQQQVFLDACNKTAEAGAKAFPDFDDARRNLTDAFSDVIGRRPEFLEAITALPNGHEVFYHLGNNLDEAAKLFRIGRVPMAIELARLSGETGKTKPVSKAPAPIKPLTGAARVATDPEKMPIDEFMKWRKKDAAERAKARYSRAS